MVSKDIQEPQDVLDVTVPPEQQAPLDLPVLWVSKDIQVFRAYRAYRAYKVRKAFKVW